MIGNKIQPFKFWCNKVLPTVYDDSMSYYECLNKLTEYLNEVIENINALLDSEEAFQASMTEQWSEYSTDLTEQWTQYRDNLTEQWTTYKNYIDNYFTNLDVQNEINHKLDVMASDGTLDALIAPYIQSDVPTAVTTWLNAHVDPVGSAVTVDDSLTIQGSAADAKTTGDRIDVCFQPRSVPSGATTLAESRELGVYHFSSNALTDYTDLPSDASTTEVSTLINITNTYNNAITIQYFLQLQNQSWKRLIVSATGVVYSTWVKINETDLITKLETLYNEAFRPRRRGAGVTSLANMRDIGVYPMNSTEAGIITDLPSGASVATSTLINITSAYASGAYTLQYLLQLPDKVWKRMLVSQTGVVYSDWVDISTNEYASKDMLYGKKLVTAGDSYTAADFSGDYASYNRKNFGYYIAQRNNMNFTNSGISGSTMAVTNDDSGRNPFSVDRYTAVPVDTDYLTIWFGINDASHTDLGTINDNTNTTFYGAWNVVLNYYLTNRPFMKILIVVTTGATAEYRQAIRDVAEKWGYPYMDWVKDVSIPAFFERDGMSNTAKALRKDAFGYNTFNAHPNPQWHEYASTIIESKLRSI